MRLFTIFLNGHFSEASVIDILKWRNCKIFYLLKTPSRSNHRRCSIKKMFLKKFTKFRGKTPAMESVVDFLWNRHQHRCFPVKFAKVLRTPILKNICERLLLPFLGFTKLNLNVFLWFSWRHCFLYNNIINCYKHVPPLRQKLLLSTWNVTWY